jgi:hypothetical protein
VIRTFTIQTDTQNQNQSIRRVSTRSTRGSKSSAYTPKDTTTRCLPPDLISSKRAIRSTANSILSLRNRRPCNTSLASLHATLNFPHYRLLRLSLFLFLNAQRLSRCPPLLPSPENTFLLPLCSQVTLRLRRHPNGLHPCIIFLLSIFPSLSF